MMCFFFDSHVFSTLRAYRTDVKRESLTASQPGVICKVDFRVLCETFRQCTLGVSPFASVAILTDSQFAINDKVIFKDMRVLRNLLDLEPKYIPPCNYFGTVQKDIQPFMRKVVATWMSEVCEEQRCEDQVFPLAVNFLDRFLCRCSISRRQLQLTAAVSLLLASKIRQCHALYVDLLCFYTDHSITPDEMRSWELLFLSRLKWNIAAVTGFDYVDHVLQRVAWGENNPVVRRHAHTLVSVCYTEPVSHYE
uniref:Cyclin-like domain-containing protein n=1 Tax=Timema douglasi TaxID=61478 RepID=A0A7R8Z2Y0_TIMDO|nr:unnamed protein product [Timema douglasi]